jgi:hypothetical protein
VSEAETVWCWPTADADAHPAPQEAARNGSEKILKAGVSQPHMIARCVSGFSG